MTTSKDTPQDNGFRSQVLAALPKINRLYEIIIGEGEPGLLERVRILEAIQTKRIDRLEKSHKVFWYLLSGLIVLVVGQIIVFILK
jgi:hypothetical protein